MQIRSLAQRLIEELLTRCLLRGRVVFRGKNSEARYLPQDQMEADRKQFTDPRDGEAEYTHSPPPLFRASPPPTELLLIILSLLHLTRPKDK